MVPRSAISDNGSSLHRTVLQHVVLCCSMLRCVAQHAVPGHAIRDAERSARTSQSSMRQPRVRRAVGLTVDAAVGDSAAGTRTRVTQTRTREIMRSGRAVTVRGSARARAATHAPLVEQICAQLPHGMRGQHSRPHLHRDWGFCHIRTGTGARPCHICTGTGFGQSSPESLSPSRLRDRSSRNSPARRGRRNATYRRSHLPPIPLTADPTCRRSHLPPFPLTADPTYRRSHLVRSHLV